MHSPKNFSLANVTGFDGTIAFPKTLKNNKKYINFSILENDSTVIEKSALIIRNLNVLDIKEDSPLVYSCSPFDNTNFALIGKSFLKNYELIFDFIENFLYYLNFEFFFANYERTLSAYFQFAQMDLARASLELIQVLRTLINSSAKNLHKLQICLRFYSFYNKLDIQATL